MDFRNWLLLLTVIGIVGFSSYYIYNSPYVEEKIEKAFPSPTETVKNLVLVQPSDWAEYTGQKIKFYHPQKWAPVEREPFGGATVENVDLNIPEATDNSISYFVTEYDLVKPEDIVEEEEIIVKDRKWTKWVREGDGYVSYDIYTKENLNTDEAESFGVHVTLEKKNEKLEEELLILVNSIEFNSSSSASTTITPTIKETD